MQSLSGDNATLQFRAAMQAAGLDYPGDIIPDGRLQRFKVNGDRTPDGWYVFHPDGVPAGAFGYWKRDISETWCAKPDHYLTPAERAENERRWREAREQRDAEQRKLQKAAKTKASRIWNESPPAPADHPYLQRKGVTIPGSRIAGDKLLIPLSDASGELHTLQYIAPDGKKRFLKDGRKQGAWFALGALANADQAYLCEGVATAASVYAATGLPAVAAMDAGNLESVALAIRKAHPALTLIFAADHDDPEHGNVGVAKATNAARQVSGIVVYPPAPKTDFNDLHLSDGLEAVRERLALAANVDSPIGEKQPPLHRFVMIEDFLKSPPNELSLIDGYLQLDSLAAYVGDSESFKSFILIDMTCHIATKTPYLGRDVKQGFVLYVAGEGENGIKKRFKAWFEHHNLPFQNIAITTVPAALCEPGNAERLVEEIQAFIKEVGVTPVLIVLDTLNTNFGAGDENSTKDMTLFVNGMRALRIATHAAIVTAHHCGHNDKTRQRGSIVLTNSVDWSYLVERKPETMITTMTNKKSKDESKPPPVSFELVVKDLSWLDEKGRPMTSCVLVPTNYVPSEAKAKPLPEQQRKALKLLDELYQQQRSNLEAAGHDPNQARVTVADWYEAMRGICDNRGSRNRIRSSLIDGGHVRIENGFAYPTR